MKYKIRQIKIRKNNNKIKNDEIILKQNDGLKSSNARQIKGQTIKDNEIIKKGKYSKRNDRQKKKIIEKFK